MEPDDMDHRDRMVCQYPNVAVLIGKQLNQVDRGAHGRGSQCVQHRSVLK